MHDNVIGRVDVVKVLWKLTEWDQAGNLVRNITADGSGQVQTDYANGKASPLPERLKGLLQGASSA